MDQRVKKHIQHQMYVVFQDCQNAALIIPKMAPFISLQDAINQENENEIRYWTEQIERTVRGTGAFIDHALGVMRALKKVK